MTTPSAYMMKESGTALEVACTVTGDSSVTIKWKNTKGEDKTSSATQETYGKTAAGQRKSTLKITTLSTTDTTTFTCYTDFGDAEQVKQTIQLHVVGKYRRS